MSKKISSCCCDGRASTKDNTARVPTCAWSPPMHYRVVHRDNLGQIAQEQFFATVSGVADHLCAVTAEKVTARVQEIRDFNRAQFPPTMQTKEWNDLLLKLQLCLQTTAPWTVKPVISGVDDACDWYHSVFSTMPKVFHESQTTVHLPE